MNFDVTNMYFNNKNENSLITDFDLFNSKKNCGARPCALGKLLKRTII